MADQFELTEAGGAAQPAPENDEPTQADAPIRMDGHRVYDHEQMRGALGAGCAWLEQHIDTVNALNVFPVPDGDTGTNMTFTMRAALDELGDREFDSVSDLTQVVSHGALMGARGNSGVILSQILRGIAKGLDGKRNMTALDLAAALVEGSATAYKGVIKPVEGTILTVVREASVVAEQAAQQGASIPEVLEFTLDEAKASLLRTPTLLRVLAEANVVDSGGQGLVYILEGMFKYSLGETLESGGTGPVREVHAEMVAGEYNYDTQFVIKGENLDVATIRDKIDTFGDSTLVVGDEKAVKVHVHCDHPGEAVEYALTWGILDAIIIENMQLQYEEFVKSSTPAELPRPTLPTPESLSDTGIVAVCSGAGLEKVFGSLGVDGIVQGGQTMNPSTQDLLQAVEASPHDKVILLPNNGNIILAAQQAQELAEKDVAVVPTKTVPQGISALLAFNYQAELADNVAQMVSASSMVDTIEVTRAVRTTQINGLAITEGQFIGLVNDDLVTANEDLDVLLRDLLERVEAEDFEILTIYYGQDTSEDEANAHGVMIDDLYPDLEIEIIDGGQAHYCYIISVE